jgi:hypothetical protein
MAENSDLSIYRGKDVEITDHIKIRQPTIGEVEEYGEKEYYSLISTFIATPFDMIAQLDQQGIDFTQIKDFELFIMLMSGLEQDKTSILFGDVDFSKYRVVSTKTGISLMNENSIISEPVYRIIAKYIRKLHCIAPPKYDKVGNEATKRKLIEFAYDDLKYAKRKPYKSQLQGLVSALVNHPYFKLNYFEVWDMPIFAFYDSLQRIGVISGVEHLCQGIYTGKLDGTKINKKELDWTRPIG